MGSGPKSIDDVGPLRRSSYMERREGSIECDDGGERERAENGGRKGCANAVARSFVILYSSVRVHHGASRKPSFPYTISHHKARNKHTEQTRTKTQQQNTFLVALQKI